RVRGVIIAGRSCITAADKDGLPAYSIIEKDIRFIENVRRMGLARYQVRGLTDIRHVAAIRADGRVIRKDEAIVSQIKGGSTDERYVGRRTLVQEDVSKDTKRLIWLIGNQIGGTADEGDKVAVGADDRRHPRRARNGGRIWGACVARGRVGPRNMA